MTTPSKNPPRPKVTDQSLYQEGQALNKAGQYTEAINVFSRALKISPTHGKARLGRGLALQRRGDHNRAITDFDEVLRHHSDWAAVYVIHYNRAVSRRALGQLLNAAADCRQALTKNPEYADARYLLGRVLKEIGNLDEAVRELSTLLASDPSYHEAVFLRGTVFSAQEKWEDAVADYTEYVDNTQAGNSTSVHAVHLLRGHAHFQLGRNGNAVADLTAAISLKPDDGTAYMKRARVYKDMGMLSEADSDEMKGQVLQSRSKRKKRSRR